MKKTCLKSRVNRGSVLLVVLIVVALLSLGAYTFTAFMTTEVEAVVAYGREAEARAFAESGIELAAAVLSHRDESTGPRNLYHNPDQFRAISMRESASVRGRGAFSLVAPVENDDSSRSVRFGLIDESGKINLNTLLKHEKEEEGAGQAILMAVPGMTIDIADAILDWLDPDDTPREHGAEAEYYMTLSPPYMPNNGKFESVDELLLVKGVTPGLLYGEDANRNGILDPNENDGDASPPSDDADGTLNVGWVAYFTVSSREKNRKSDGSERINLNHNVLTELYDQLEEEHSEEIAKFIVAFRLNGPDETAEETAAMSLGSGSTAKNSGLSKDEQKKMQQFTQSLAKTLVSGGGKGKVTRGGMDLSKGASFPINSIYDVIGATVTASINGATSTLQSPWPSDAGTLQGVLPQLMDDFTTTPDEFLEGRININQARRETLLGIPGMTEDLASKIMASKMIGSNGEPLTGVVATHQTTGWLLLEELVDLPTMRKLDRYLTTRGDVYRVQSVGYFESGGPVVRIDAVIDATQTPPRIVTVRNLSDLGRGYSMQMLTGGAQTGP